MRQDPAVVFRTAARRRCYEIAEEIVATIEAYPGTPDRSGNLKRGYKAERTETGADVVNPDAYWWTYQEFGTLEMAARPHVRPSIEIVRARRLGGNR